MKKLFLATLTLALMFTLFSCLSGDPVEVPTPTRPDLDLPLPVVTDPSGTMPTDPDIQNKWLYDPNPNDDVYIYGGSFGDVGFVLTMHDFKAELVLENTQKMTKAEKMASGISGPNTTHYIVYGLRGLNYSKYDTNGGSLILTAEEMSITSSLIMNAQSENAKNDYVAKKTAWLNELAKNKHINERELNDRISYLSGETIVKNARSVSVSVELNNENGTCIIYGIDCIIDNEQYKLENVYTRGALKSTSFDVKDSESKSVITKTVQYGNGYTSFNYYSNGDDTYSYTKITYLPNGEVKFYDLIFENNFTKLELSFFEDGRVSGKTSYISKSVIESSIGYFENGDVSYRYYIDGDRSYDVGYYENGVKSKEIVYEIDKTTLKTKNKISYTARYENGQIFAETKKEGDNTVSKMYYESGKLFSHQITNSESAFTVHYYESGAKKTEQISEKNTDGTSYLKYKTEWNENGTLKYDYSGEINGDVNYERKYDENGVLLSEMKFISGEYSETGYYPSGKILYKKSNNYGNSSALYYREDGSFEFKRTYLTDKSYFDEYPEIDGKQIIKSYKADGTPIKIEVASDGILTEETVFGYQGGVLTDKTIHDYVRNTFENYSYNASGKLESHLIEKIDINGKLTFYRYTVYYENGNPKTVEEGDGSGAKSYTDYAEDGTVYYPIPE